MSGDFQRPDSEKSRRDLLDEIYYLRDIAGEREEQARQLQHRIDELLGLLRERTAQLEQVLSSNSWRLMAPLRRVMRWMRASRGARPSLDPCDDLALESIAGTPEVRSARESAPSRSQRHAREPMADHPQPRSDSPLLFVDVTELALRNGHTGVQRVVREVLRALLDSPSERYTVVPVRAESGQGYRCARTSAASFSGNPPPDGPDQAIEARPGDIFLGLDHAMDAVVEHADELAAMSASGVALYFVCNDTLPLSRPDCFPPEVGRSFRGWLETIARLADGIACISRTTEAELRNWLDALQVTRTRPLKLGWFHLGSDIEAVESKEITAGQATALDILQNTPTFLMVGTIEPRKGHAQTLEAFDLLWQQGNDVALVLVGWSGWMTDIIARRIRHSEEFGKRLFWFNGASDGVLEELYNHCTALLAPSEAEGFGLPLVEAARHALPILCRDLPVFREIAGEHAAYFSGHDAESLASAIRDWLAMRERGHVPAPDKMRLLHWRQSTEQLLELVLKGHWSSSWQPGQRFCFPVVDPRVQSTNGRLEHGRVVVAGFTQSWPVALSAGRYRLWIDGVWERDVGSAQVELLSASREQSLAKHLFEHAGAAGGRLPGFSFELTTDVVDLMLRIEAGNGGRFVIERFGLEPQDARR